MEHVWCVSGLPFRSFDPSTGSGCSGCSSQVPKHRKRLPARFDIPAGALAHGANEIVFRFNDNLGGATRGFYVFSITIAVSD